MVDFLYYQLYREVRDFILPFECLDNVMKMKKIALIVMVGVLSAACTTVSTTALFKPGVTAVQKQRDLDSCKIASFRSVPQTIVTQVSGGYYDAGDVRCSERKDSSKDKGGVYCRRVGQVYIPPSTTTRDVNADLRWRFVRSCLRDKGYQVVERLRACSNEAERQRAINARTLDDLVCNPDTKLDY